MEKKAVIAIVASLVLVLLAPLGVHAATLYFSPSSGSYNVGSTFSVGVNVSSSAQAMNAVSGNITFSQNILEVTSLSKIGSIMSLWVQEPSFFNTNGTVDFEGIVLNPGYIGSAGRIITVNFRVKAIGNASIAFSSGSILANDGLGTNILTSLGSASFTLNKGTPTTPSVSAGTPLAPAISSLTHPDSDTWYSTNAASFTWPVPNGVTAAKLLAGRLPRAIPSISYTPAIDSKDVSDLDLEDGIWYFHVSLKNKNGFGEASHFRFQIDTEKPERFDIAEIPREDLIDPRVEFRFVASDATSGIGHYEIQIDEETSEIWSDDGTHVYKVPILKYGRHTLLARAIDGAGNSLEASVEFVIDPLLWPPEFTSYPKELKDDEILKVQGISAYPNGSVTLWMQKEKETAAQYTVDVDKDGNFAFVSDEVFSTGKYTLWAEAIDGRGARSEFSERITIEVKKAALLDIAIPSISAFGFLMILIILLLILAFWYGFRKITSLKKDARKKVRKIERSTKEIFSSLERNIQKHIKKLEETREKGFTEKEKEIVHQLKKEVKEAEKAVEEEIKDIGKRSDQ